MSTRQKCIIAALAVADIVVILIVALYVLHTTRYLFSDPSSFAFESSDCRWHMALLMAQAGLSGKASLDSSKTLRIEITYPLAPEQQVDEAAQAMWIAFDAVWTLQSHYPACAAFNRVEVTVTAQQGQGGAVLKAAVSAADLAALNAGNLSEEAFIERTSYSVSALR